MDDESLPIARPTPSVIPEHRAIIDSLSLMGITVSIDRGYCHWTCGYEAGQIGAYGRPSADRFFARLTSHPPTTEDDFLELVP